MYFDDAFVTTTSALEVASALDYFVQEGITDKHFEITVRSGSGEESTIWVRPILAQDFIPTANDGQIVKCIADDGRRIDILLPQIKLRDSTPASVVVGTAV